MFNEWQLHSPIFEYEARFPDFATSWSGHKLFAYDLVTNIKPATIVELGSYKGTSFFSFCQAVKDNGIASKLFAVDSWKGDPHTGSYDDKIYNEFRSIKEEFYGDLDIEILRMDFDDALVHFNDLSIDILHIDGYHTYEAVCHDFSTWYPKLTQNAIVLFHDICEIKEDFGVHIFWNELTQKYENHFSFFHSHGLGVLFLGSSGMIYESIKNRQFGCVDYYFLLSDQRKYLGLYQLLSSLSAPNDPESFSILDLSAEDLKQLLGFESDVQIFNVNLQFIKDLINRQNEKIEKMEQKYLALNNRLKLSNDKIQEMKRSITWTVGRIVLFPAIIIQMLYFKLLKYSRSLIHFN